MTQSHFFSLPPILMICALTTATALAEPVTFLQRAPSDPARIPVTVDQSQLTGTLDPATLADLIEAGRLLFEAKFTTADGATRPLATQATIPTHFKHAREVLFQRASGPDANRCSSCHNDPVVGAAGDFVANVFTSEGTESADFDNVDPQFSNERGTNHMFGAGLMELLAREMTADLHTLRAEALAEAKTSGQAVEIALVTKDIAFGTLTVHPDATLDLTAIEGIDADLVVRPFSQKGTIPSLRMFTVTAMNTHHGMQAEERFGAKMTGEADFDGDGHVTELTAGHISAVTAWQAALPAPVPVAFDNPDWQAAAARGADLFAGTGCAECHRPALPLANLEFADPGPYDTAGTLTSADVAAPAIYDFATFDWVKALPRDAAGNVLVPIFGDLKRHVIADNRYTHFANELQGQAFVARDSFLTSELWGVADTAPYGHRGDLTEIEQAIVNHGGEARASRDAYADLQDAEKADLITYLMTLRMPQ